MHDSVHALNFFNITMDKIQGESISFNFDVAQTGLVSDMTEVEKLIIYFYTNTSFISRHSISTQSGYHTMEIAGSKASGVLPSEDTKRMRGALMMDILIIDKDKQRRTAYSTPTGINIVYKPITEET
jgi:hypothetical protein